MCLISWNAYDMARWNVAPAFLRPDCTFRYGKGCNFYRVGADSGEVLISFSTVVKSGRKYAR